MYRKCLSQGDNKITEVGFEPSACRSCLQYIYICISVACGQGMQIMHCMTNETFFLKNMILGRKLVFILESQTIFLSYP